MGRNRDLILGILLTLSACGDDADPASGDGSDGSDGSDDGTDDDSSGTEGADETGDAIACEATARDVIPRGTDILSNVTVTDTALVMLVTDATHALPSRIDTVGVDGSGRTTLHTGTDAIAVISVFAHSDTAYFLERDYADPVPVDVLHAVPIAGGEPEPVGAVALENAAIVDVDDTGIYLVRTTITPIGTVFERVDIASGALTTIGASTDTGVPLQLHASADRIVFHSGGVGADAGGPREVLMVPKSGVDATPTLLWSAAATDDDPCGFPLCGMFPTPTRIACGFSGVATRAPDGTMPEVLIERGVFAPLNVLVAVDGEQLYITDTTPSTDPSGHMYRIATDDATKVPVACDLGKIAYALVDGTFQNQVEYEVVVGATDVFWVEEYFDGSSWQFALRAATK